MTPADLAHRGRILYGPCWQTPLAKALGVHRETVVRWAGGKRGIPADLPERLKALAAERRNELETL